MVDTNFCTNPSLETTVNGWTAQTNTTRAQSTEQAHVGTNSLKVVCAGVGGNEGVNGNFSTPALQGETWTFSIYAYGAGTIRLGIDEYNNVAAFQSGGQGTAVVLAESWSRYQFSRTLVSATTAFIRVSVRTNSAQAVTWYIDAIQIEKSAAATDYFDGSTSDTDEFTYDWTGSAHGSTSTRTATEPEGSGIIIPLFAGRRRRS